MAETDLVLRFEIADGQVPDAANVALALLAWVDLMKTAGEAVEPGSSLEVGLTGVEDGSDIFKLALRKVQAFGETVQDGMSEFPLPSKAAIALGGLIGSTIVGVSITNMMTPDPRIPDDQMEVFEENNRLLQESVDLQKQSMRFYGILQDEPAIEQFEVIRPYDDQVMYTVPRSEFAARSGLWIGDDDDQPAVRTETRTATWDVVLIKAVLVPEPRRWGFARDGIEFTALMSDKSFLQAIHDKTLPVQMAEGVRMKIEVKYRETYDGEVWLPVPQSHRVSRVLDPSPPLSLAPLFFNTGTI